MKMETETSGCCIFYSVIDLCYAFSEDNFAVAKLQVSAFVRIDRFDWPRPTCTPDMAMSLQSRAHFMRSK